MPGRFRWWALRGLLLDDADLGDRCGLDDAHDVRFVHDQQILAVELDLGAGPLAEQDAVALLDVERHHGTPLVAGARTDGDDLAFHRLFLDGVGNYDTARPLVFWCEAGNH